MFVFVFESPESVRVFYRQPIQHTMQLSRPAPAGIQANTTPRAANAAAAIPAGAKRPAAPFWPCVVPVPVGVADADARVEVEPEALVDERETAGTALIGTVVETAVGVAEEAG